MKHRASIMAIIVRMFLIAVAMMALTGLANAHDWYPGECCSDRDCRAVDDPREQDGGFYFSGGVFAPYGIVRMSPDGKWHLCEGPGKKLLCVFGPTGGF